MLLFQQIIAQTLPPPPAVVITDAPAAAAAPAVPSAVLVVDSQTKGMLPPKLTEAQKASIPSPADGLLLYQKDNDPGVQVHVNGQWEKLSDGKAIKNGDVSVTADPTPGNKSVSIKVGAQEKVKIKEDGKMGIGKPNPTEMLDVEGKIKSKGGYITNKPSPAPAPSASALLDLDSEDKGALLPRMAKTKKELIPSPAEGLLIYQTDDDPGFRFHKNGHWEKISDGKKLEDKGMKIEVTEGTTNSDEGISIKNGQNEHVKVSKDGKVGLGKPMPEEKLDVNGKIKSSGLVLAPGSTPLQNTISELLSINAFGQVSRMPINMVSFSGGIRLNSKLEVESSSLGALHVKSGSISTAIIEGSSDAGTWISLGNTHSGGKWFSMISTADNNGEGAGKFILRPAASYNVTYTGNNAFAMLHSNGNIGIGTESPEEKLEVNGNILASGNVISNSDARYKTEVQIIPDALQKIGEINGVYYRWKHTAYPEKAFSEKKQIGFIAQELEKQFPEVVFTDDKGYKSVDYSRLTPILLEAIKEQQRQIEALQLKNTVLEDQAAVIQSLEVRLLSLERKFPEATATAKN